MAWIKALSGSSTINVSGTHGSVAASTTFTESLINSRNTITGTVTVVYPQSLGSEYGQVTLVIGGVDHAIPGVSGSTKVFNVNLTTTPGQSVTLKVRNNTSNYAMTSVAWNLDFS